MPRQSPAWDVPFIGGGNTKLPEKLLPPGALSICQNTAVRKPGRVEKRWGSSRLPAPPQTSINWDDAFGIGIPGSTQLGNELLISGPVGTTGTFQHGWSPASGQWIQKGAVQPIAMTEKTAFAGDMDCQATDLALNFNTPVAGGCFGCYVYQTATGVDFCVYDDKSGQNVMSDTVLAVGGSNPRVVSVGPYFCVFCLIPVGGSLGLYCFTIDPFLKTVTALASGPIDSTVTNFDARVVTGSTVGHGGTYVAISYARTGGLFILGLDPWAQAFCVNPFAFSGGANAVAMGVFSANVGVLYNHAGATMQIQWFSLALVAGNNATIDTVAGIPGGWGKATLQPTPLGYTAAWETNGVQSSMGDFTTLPAIKLASGVVGSATAATGTYIKRNESIAGDLFTLGGQIYLPTVYQGQYGGAAYLKMSSLQPTYFVLQVVTSFTTVGGPEPAYVTVATATAVARFAQDNAGGPTLNKMCPQVSTDLAGNLVWGIGLGTQQTAAFNGVYQNVRAVARAVCKFGVQQFSATLGDNMHMTGGFLSSYDGASFKEHNFHLTPEPPRVDACTVGCCRVAIGYPSPVSVVNATGFIPDSNNQDPVNNGPNVNSGLEFTAIAAGPLGNGITVLISLTSQTNPTYVNVLGNNVVITPITNGTVVTETNGGVIAALAAFNLANPTLALVTAACTSTTTPTTLLSNWQASTRQATLAGGSLTAVSTGPLTPTNWTIPTETFQAILNPAPVLGTVTILDAGVVVASDAITPGTIVGTDNGQPITGSIAGGALTVTIAGASHPNPATGGAMTAAWMSSPAIPETSDVYFPPDSQNPGGLIYGSGWQIRPSSYVVITAQSNGPGAAWNPANQGGPVGYVWFSVDGVGADPVPFLNPGTGPGANVPCALLSTDTAQACAQKFRQAIVGSGLSNFVTVSPVVQNVIPPTGPSAGATSKVTIAAVLGTSWSAGAPIAYSEDFRLDGIGYGVGTNTGSWMSCPPGSKIMPGGYFVVQLGVGGIGNAGATSSFAVFYYTVNGVGLPPAAPLVLLPAATSGPGVNAPANPLANPPPSPPSVISGIYAIPVLSSSSPIEVAAATYVALTGAGGGPGGSFGVKRFLNAYDSMLQIGSLLGESAGAAPYNVSCSGILPDGLYEYTDCWEWLDAKGQLHQSGVSEASIVNITGASPTFDPYGYRYDDPLTALKQNPDQHGMLLFGFPVGGSSPFLINPSLWATQKLNATLAHYRTIVSPGDPPEFFRVTDAAQIAPPAQATAALVQPNPLLPNATVSNPLTGLFAPQDVLCFIDTTPDSQAQQNTGLYTNGGVAPNAPVPSCSYLHVHQGRLWALSAEDPNQTWPSNVYTPEEQFAVEFCTEFIEDVDPSLGQCVSLGSCDDKLIQLCQNGLFYLTGPGPTPAGVGDFNVPQRIMCEVGAVSPVFLETFDGFWWLSPIGLYFCDRNLIAGYKGAPAEGWVNPQGQPQMYLQSAVISPNGQTELRWYFVKTPGAANPATDYCVTWNWVNNWWSQSMKIAANSACIWYPPGQTPTVVWVDGLGIVRQETPNQYLDDGAAIVRQMKTSPWGSQIKQGYFMAQSIEVLGTFGGLPTPIAAAIQVRIGYDFEEPSKPVIWQESKLLSSTGPGDGMVAQFRAFIPIGPRGGTMQALTFLFSDVPNEASPNDPGMALEMVTCEIEPIGGAYRLGPLRTIG